MCGSSCSKASAVVSEIQELKEALRVAADALSIAADWNVDDVQVDVPETWGLDAEDGMYRTNEIANKIRQLANKPSVLKV